MTDHDIEAQAAARRRGHWQRNLALTRVLLAVWALVTFGVGWFADALQFRFFGWPFSFWMAAQGSLIVYVLITWVYARTMARLDREYGVGEDG